MFQIRVLIADDYTVFREGLCLLLAQQPEIEVVGSAADGFQALRMAEALQPDIMLLDIRMPEMDGLEVLRKIREKSPRTKVLVLSGFIEDDLITEALENGAKGYLPKTLAPRDLVKAIRATHAGELWAETKVLAMVFENLLKKVDTPPLPWPEHGGNLTDREKEVVKCVIQGLTNKEIAAQLGISDKTVKRHLSNIFSKLKVSRRLHILLRRIADHQG